jgi:DpnII restriction endonuclease
MARAKTERSRSKTSAIEDLTQSIEQLQSYLPKVEDLGREGFPYIEGARARTELQLRECIKRAFGEKSPEYQAHRHHKLAMGTQAETKQTVSLVKMLIATLEEKKLELQGLKPSPPEKPSATSTPTPPERPQMTLVPPTAPTAQVTITSAAPVTPPPITMSVPLTTNVDMGATSPASPAPPTVPAPESVAPPPSAEYTAPPQPTAPMPKPPQIAPDQVSTLFRPNDTGSVAPPIPQTQRPVSAPPPSPVSTPVSEPALPAANPSTVQQATNLPQHSATQEVPLAHQPAQVRSVPRPATAATSDSSLQAVDHLELCRKLCWRFHAIARQLRLRGEYRATLAVEDEVDVQDLLHALLRVQFDDIGTDEWVPSYTNGAPRTTFLLDRDRLAIVVKKTRTGLSTKDLMDQFHVDIERYRTQERCTTLFCFVYDPEGRIGNPRGLESDLATISDHFTVDVLVAPK